MTINSVAAELLLAREFVGDYAIACGFHGEDLFSIKVAVSEACTNALEHGSPKGPKNQIFIECSCSNGDFVVEIRDQGSFRRQAPEPNNSLQMRGRGLLLMLSLMDKVVFDETPHGTRVILTKHFASPG